MKILAEFSLYVQQLLLFKQGQALARINKEQDAQLSQRDRAAGCVIVFLKSRRLELGDNILRTL